MNLAYISYEYPPDTAVGGIATYVHQASVLMEQRGHRVEVFCGTDSPSRTEELSGVLVHRIQATRFEFPQRVAPVFSSSHSKHAFDLMESPEFTGDGLHIKKQYPALPLVVKLHTPWFLIMKLNYFYLPFSQKMRFILGGLVKGRLNKPYWANKVPKEDDMDYQITRLADQIHTPSISLGDIVSREWEIPRSAIYNIPYPFIPTKSFLDIPVETDNKRVTFIGRLETRKGIIELVKALPQVIKACPDVKFRFVGKSLDSTRPGELMLDYIKRKLKKYLSHLEFLEVTSLEIPRVLAETDICVFPSLWENFPNVCLEAMSAARGVVGSREGGMKDMLESPQAGILIDPYDARDIATGIITLLRDPVLRQKLGATARNVVIERYNQEKIGNLMEQTYQQLLR